jgi:hypothetical protein
VLIKGAIAIFGSAQGGDRAHSDLIDFAEFLGNFHLKQIKKEREGRQKI